MKILIVDDNHNILLLVKTILELNGFHAITVENGKEALKLCEQETFSLIFLDLMMEEMDGYSVIKELRNISQYEKTPIIALTAKAYKKDIETVLANGFTEHLSKPFRMEDILNIAKKYIS